MTKTNILVVEDEAIVAQEIKISLQNMGHSVASIASRGEEAIGKAEAIRPDLILMDIQLKGEMDGIEAADAIQSRFGIPVIFLTAYDDDERLKRAKFTLPYGYVLKPFRDRELRIAIEMALYAADMNARRIQAEEALRETHKMNAIAILAGGVAHEFNNALMGVTGSIDLLRMDVGHEEKVGKHFDTIKGSCRRMVSLTNQLLAYAQGGKYQPKATFMSDFVGETLPIMGHSLNQNVSVETDLSKDISAVEVDTAQLQMVLSALLINSNEAIGGEGRIRIILKNEDLGEDLVEQHPGFRPGPYVCLQVEDNGKGMDKETRAKIFDPFFTTKFQGRGMGMAAVYGIVQNHHGLLGVESEPGKGTVVRVWLPAIDVAPPESEPAGTETVIGTGTILIIEDEEVVIDVTKAMLERLGYRVMVAKTGRDAVHITETFDGRIDLALLDIKLPDMDGGKVYPLIMEARPDLKVIVCSGYSIDGPAREIIDAGAQGFLQKPVLVSTLSEKVKTVLENNP
jgi:two-component system, cell cycle sensor histidine kinase and response regulator CckA